MARGFALTDAERSELLTIPVTPDELIARHTLTDEDFVLLKSRRGSANRLGLAATVSTALARRRPEHALDQLADEGHPADPALLKHLSPLGWEHINLTGDYTWPRP